MVKSLVSESSIHMKYINQIKVEDKRSALKRNIMGLLMGFSQFGQFIVFALVFYYAGVWREKYDLNMQNVFIAIFALIFGVYGAGMANQFLGDMKVAKVSAENVFNYINEFPQIEYDPKDPIYLKANSLKPKKKTKQLLNEIKENEKNKKERLKPVLEGEIEFKNVWFKFPTRNTWTLRNLSLKISKNSNCAFVGSSGSGKSTIFQLLLRFYNIDKGTILIDGHDINTIDVSHLRSFFGLIKQEPEVYNGTIKYNVVYNTEDVSEAAIKEACETSNSNEFIESHPDNLNRNVGNRGDALSGGQKQRLTIARSVLRSPKVFLFDEATSALDTNSEKIVQDAIEKIWGNHSSITIAHRISTIRNCDKIYVLDKGRIKEKGNYDQLMMKKGLFYDLAID